VTWFIFLGDLIVMAGVIAVAVWAFLRANPADLDAAARIPLDDDGEVHVDNGDSRVASGRGET